MTEGLLYNYHIFYSSLRVSRKYYFIAPLRGKESIMLNPVFARKLDDGGPECMHWFNCYGCARLGDDCDGSEAIYDLEEGDKVYFGRHFRNGSDEPMVWDVLKVDGQKALLTSKEILTITIFHDSPDNWAHCNTRRWLNKDFLTEAFNVEEVLTIKETEQPEKGTTDRVFLLDDETAAMWVVWDE